MRKEASLGTDFLEAAQEQLRSLLPSTWVVEADTLSSAPDITLGVRAPNSGSSQLHVEVKRRVSPRDVVEVLGPRTELALHYDPSLAILVVAPWLSSRTRTLLQDRGLNYLDLTGNVWIRLLNPTVVLQTTGAENDPTPVPRERVTLTGDRAWRLMRILVDVEPPYSLTTLASLVGVSLPYASRVVSSLEHEALVRRESRLIVEADWEGLLRRWAGSRSLFDGTVHTFIAPSGPNQALEHLRNAARFEFASYTAVTGSFAAAAIAPVAAPAQLVVYVDDVDATADELGLLPTTSGADVVLLTARDPDGVRARAREDWPLPGVRTVGLSQLVVDCLTGNGRMPAEGEALISYMAGHVAQWRKPAELMSA